MPAKSTTLTRANIAERIHKEIGLPRSEAANLVESITDVMTQALNEEEIVKIASFARFEVKSKAERIGRNPKTMHEAIISPRKIVSFRPSAKLKASVNTS